MTDIAVGSIRWARRRASVADAWRRLRADKLAMISLLVLVAFAIVAIATPWFTDKSAISAVNTADNPTWAPPSREFLLGTDYLGRSVGLQVLWGARVSLFVGLMATLLTIGIGTTVGITAGFFGGWSDAALMRVTDWFLVIPFLPTAIVLAAVLNRSLWTIVFVIGITSWPSTARLLRSQVLSVRSRLYVDRSRALGAGRGHLIGRHILPNVMPLVMASTTLAVPISILTETTLSFLGLGDPTEVSWGAILNEAREKGAVTRGAWWYYMPPGMAIVMVVLAFTLLGRALETVLDPRLRES
jgi:peptide/nickel transport system permease protein